MKIVKEHIAFKRGLGSKEALSIAEYRKVDIEYFSNLKDGYYILIMEDRGDRGDNRRNEYGEYLLLQVLTDGKDKLYKFGANWAKSIDSAIKSFEESTYKGYIDYFWTGPGEDTKSLQKIKSIG